MGRIPGDPLHGRVDLIERPTLMRTGVAGQRTHTQADDGHVTCGLKRRQLLECLADWTAFGVVRERLALAALFNGLRAMKCRSMEQHVKMCILRNPIDAKAGPLGIKTAATRTPG